MRLCSEAYRTHLEEIIRHMDGKLLLKHPALPHGKAGKNQCRLLKGEIAMKNPVEKNLAVDWLTG